MERNNFKISLLFLPLIFIFVGCKKASPQAPLILKEFGSYKTKAGAGFNMQPWGISAIWGRTENATPTTLIIWEKTGLKTAFERTTLLTAAVPKELHSKPGQYKIYLLDTKTGLSQIVYYLL